MSRRSWIYVLSIISLGVALAATQLVGLEYRLAEMGALIVLALLATVAQLSRVESPVDHVAFFPTPIFFFAGVLLLPPAHLVLLIILPHLIEWVVARFTQSQEAHLRAWYIQPFNIAMYLLAAFVGRYAFGAFSELGAAWGLGSTAPFALMAAAVYLIVNQAILGQVLVFARNISWRESGVLRFESLFPEFIMLCLGIVIARLWLIDRWLIVPSLIPLVLIYRALKVPLLMQAAQTDSKTGLLNAGHFKRRFDEEFERARRLGRPIAVIMADLDLLRQINNTYGHLAGDAVLEGVGRIIRQNVRQDDLAGRFGGEEFSLVLPETDEARALLLAERIRRAVESTEFRVPTGKAPIRATISMGVAAFPSHGDSVTELVHEADVAVYQAKYQGRNRVIGASEVPHSVKLERSGAVERIEEAHAMALGLAGAGAATAAPEGAPTAARPATATATATATTTTTTTAARRAPAPGMPAAPAREESHSREPASLWLFIATVISAGVGIVMLLTVATPSPDLTALALLVAMAVAAEWLQINVYGEHSISVSMAMLVTAALSTGMPGVATVSLAIVLANQLRRGRSLSEWYKAAFNWAVHVLASLAPCALTLLIAPRLDSAAIAAAIFLISVASLVYYLVETGLIAMAISLTRRDSLLKVWRAQFGWLPNYYVVLGVAGLFLSLAYAAMGAPGMLFFALPVLILRHAQQQYVSSTNASVLELRRMNAELSRANSEVLGASRSIQQLNERLQHMNSELFRTIGTILDARDPYVAGHAAQVAAYAAAIATELGLPPARVELVYHAGLLHDLGKIAIGEHILNKPGKLTREEFEEVKRHAAIGAELLGTSPDLAHLAPFIRHHHERWDGRGYPDGLAGEEIPLEARILAVSDTVEAMASDRPYQRALPVETILGELRRGSGVQFEAAVVEAFIRLVEREGVQVVQNSARTVQQRTGRQMLMLG